VSLTFPADLSPESYEDLQAHLELILRKAKRRSSFQGAAATSAAGSFVAKDDETAN
jgi:hypothetical protein